MEKSPLTWDYLESGFAREVSGTCQPKHWEARALPLGDTRSYASDSIQHAARPSSKILPASNNPLLASRPNSETRREPAHVAAREPFAIARMNPTYRSSV